MSISDPFFPSTFLTPGTGPLLRIGATGIFGLLVSATVVIFIGRPCLSVNHVHERKRSRRFETASAPWSVNLTSPTSPRSSSMARFEIHAAAVVFESILSTSLWCSKSIRISFAPFARQSAISCSKAARSQTCIDFSPGKFPNGQSCTAGKVSPGCTVSGSCSAFFVSGFMVSGFRFQVFRTCTRTGLGARGARGRLLASPQGSERFATASRRFARGCA